MNKPAIQISCGRCSTAYSRDQWAALEFAHRISAAEVQRMVVAWPDALSVEVRVCRRCGQRIASRSRG